jgi:hypothetical protein
MINVKKAIVFLAFLIFVALCLVYPSIVSWIINLVQILLTKSRQGLLACVPLLLYGAVGLRTRAYLWKVPPDAEQMEGDKHQSASLTLAGFCFTSLSLLVSFFKDEIHARDAGPQKIIFFFCCALACFIASYMALRYRTKHFFGFISEAFIDNGFWCVMVGLWAFFSRTTGMSQPAAIVTLLLIFYTASLVLNFYYHIHYVRKIT